MWIPKKTIASLLMAGLAVAGGLSGLHLGSPTVREWDVAHPELPNLTIAVLADFHFSDPEDLKDLAAIKRQMMGQQIDLVLFAGDYIGSHSLYDSVSRETIVDALEALAFPAPAFAVLGNHDNWDSRASWVAAFEGSKISLIENTVAETRLQNVPVCLRGLGDYYSGHLKRVPIPDSCGDRTITLTHDPSGLLNRDSELDSLSFAGHTHCGQIAFPWIGAPVVPTRAPREMHCGRFDRGHVGVTSGGLGASIIPLRFGPDTEPGWELVRIQGIE